MTALSILHDSRRGANHLKLSAHFVNLLGLLSELGCESLYLFLLLRDRCLQLLNFVIHRLELGARGRLRSARLRCARCARTHRYALTPRTLRCGTRVVRVNTIDAKVAEKI